MGNKCFFIEKKNKKKKLEETNLCVELWLNRILNHCLHQLRLKNSIVWRGTTLWGIDWTNGNCKAIDANRQQHALVTNRYSFSATRNLHTSTKWHLCYINWQRLNSGTHSCKKIDNAWIVLRNIYQHEPII